MARTVEPTFEASAIVLASHQGAAQSQRFGVSLTTAPSVGVQAYRAAALSAPLLGEALRTVSPDDVDRQRIELLRSQIRIDHDSTIQSSLLHIYVQDPSPESAAELANAIAEQLIAWEEDRATQHLSEIVAILEGQVLAIDSEISSLRTSGDVAPEELAGRVALRAEQMQQLYYARTLQNSAMGLLEIVDPALVPLAPVAPRPRLMAALGFVLGLFGAYGLFLVLEAMNTRIRSIDELAQAVDLPILASFSPMPQGQRRLPSEAVRYLRTNVLFALHDAHPKIILVASALPGEGKSSVALSLAESFVRNDHRTLLVDADMRKPVLATHYGVTRAKPQLADYLANSELPLRPKEISMEGARTLHLVPSFSHASDPTELLGSGFREWVRTLEDKFDVIIVDSAPILPVADALTIAPHVSGTILVAHVGRTDSRELNGAMEMLSRIGARLVGVVAANVQPGSRQGGYQYSYGYGYGNSAEHPGPIPESAPVSAGAKVTQSRT